MEGEFDPIGDGHAKAQGRRLPRLAAIVFYWVVGIVASLGLVAAVGIAALTFIGPIRLDSISATAQSALREIAGPSGDAHVGSVHFELTWRDGPAVDLDDVRVGREGVASVVLPRVAIRLALLPLLVGEVHPRSVSLEAPTLIFDAAGFAREAAKGGPDGMGGFLPPGGQGGAPLPVFTLLTEAIEATISRGIGIARAQGFQILRVHGGAVEISRVTDKGETRRVRVGAIEAEAIVDGPAGEFDAGFSADGEVGRWSMRFTQRRGDDGARRLTFNAEDVTLHDLIGPGDKAFNFTLPFYPKADVGFSPEGRLTGADFDVRLGAGTFRFGPEKEDEALLDEVLAHLVWTPSDRSFVVDQLAWAAGDTYMALKGRVAPPKLVGAPWTIALIGDHGAFKPRDVPGESIPFLGGNFDATFDPATGFLDIQAAQARFGRASVTTSGRFDISGPEPKLKLDLTFPPLTVAEAIRVWPHWVAPDARQWMISQAESGRVSDLRIKVDLPRLDQPNTWPGTAMQVWGRFDGLKFKPLGNLPAVVGGEGRVTVADRRFEAIIEKGQVATKWGKKPTLEKFSFVVPDIFVKPPKGAFRFQISGDVPALAEIVNAEPLAVLDQAGIKADGLSGTGVVSTAIDLVFTPVLDPAKIEFRVEAQLDKFASQGPIQGRRFQDGKLKVVVDPRGVDVAGRATVDDVPADVHVYESHAASSRSSEKRDFKIMLDDAARQRLGLDLGGLVQGAIGVSASQPDPNVARTRIEADLGPARLVVAQLGWTKGAGVAAKATFDLVEDDKGTHVENLAIDSEGLTLRGVLHFDKERNITAGEFSKFSFRRGDDARLKLLRGNDKIFYMTLEATSFDARGLLQAGRKPSGASEPTSATDKIGEMAVKLKAGKLVGFNDTTLGDVAFEARYRGGMLATLEGKARTASGKPLAVAIKPEADHRRFTVTADDAGAVLSFFDLFDRIREGKLAVTARLGAPGVSEGTFRLTDFRLMEEPKSGRAATAKEGRDGIRQIELRRVEFDRSTDFDRASARFSQRDGVINVSDGVAKGNSVGATATGQIDLNNARLSLSGTYIPAYGLNNLVGKIPIVGAIAGAGANEGLVGITFRVVGPIEDPILQINPLSAVAPGIFRRIFEFQNEDISPGTGDPNAPVRLDR